MNPWKDDLQPWIEKAMAITPLGTQTRSKGPLAYGINDFIPPVCTGGRGCVLEVNNKDFYDWTCGLGAVSLGYTDVRVDRAIREQLDRGISFSVPHYLEAEVGEMLREIIPCMQPDGMVRFVKTGSEGCEGAVRIARKATGREYVATVRTGYHGWHSWFQAIKPEHPGVPVSYGSTIIGFDYNQPVEDIFWLGADIAAVILEPMLFDVPNPGWLESLRAVCDQHGIVLIFDECVTGFRIARAGGQERFGVIPDLAVFGKGMANGMPLAAICGKRALMEHADVVSGTFGGETLSLAAAKAVLQVYDQENVCGHMATIGTLLNTGLFANSGTMFKIHGWEEVCQYLFETGDPERNLKCLALLTQEMAKRGILWHPRIRYVSLAHTEYAVNRTIEAFAEAYALIDTAVKSDNWDLLSGKLPDVPFARK